MGGISPGTPGPEGGSGVPLPPDSDPASMLENLLGGARQQLGTTHVEGVSGGGAVRVTMDGEQNVLSVKLSPEVVDPGDIEMLEELIVSALADAAGQAQAAKLESVSNLARMFGLGEILGDGLQEP
ncbi:MAG: YbaB/EbfC family nucleoid-associated protein [Dehalococcoidia bacterium]|nr:YbaB/EbfC family nucleoid-associated protein [Dehalococcoidia bacterium]